MYKGEYQGHSFIELLTVQGKKPGENWRFCDTSIRKIYDRAVKGFVFKLEGPSTSTGIQLPKEPRMTRLVQPFLGFQVCVPPKGDFSVESTIMDSSGVKRRIVLSTVSKSIQVNPLHARTPLSLLTRGTYNNLVVDMRSIVPRLWSGRDFKSIEAISLSPTCKVRKVFTLNCRPISDSPPNCPVDPIPRQISIPPDVPQTIQVVDVSWLDDSSPKGAVGKKCGGNSRHPPKSTAAKSPSTCTGDSSPVGVTALDTLKASDYDQFAREVLRQPLLPSDSFEAAALATMVSQAEEPDSSHHFSRGEDYSSSEDIPVEMSRLGRLARGEDLGEDHSPHFSQPPSSPPIYSSTTPRSSAAGPPTEEPSAGTDLELLYDTCLDCYYDPQTMKYYEIIN